MENIQTRTIGYGTLSFHITAFKNDDKVYVSIPHLAEMLGIPEERIMKQALRGSDISKTIKKSDKVAYLPVEQVNAILDMPFSKSEMDLLDKVNYLLSFGEEATKYALENDFCVKEEVIVPSTLYPGVYNYTVKGMSIVNISSVNGVAIHIYENDATKVLYVIARAITEAAGSQSPSPLVSQVIRRFPMLADLRYSQTVVAKNAGATSTTNMRMFTITGVVLFLQKFKMYYRDPAVYSKYDQAVNALEDHLNEQIAIVKNKIAPPPASIPYPVFQSPQAPASLPADLSDLIADVTAMKIDFSQIMPMIKSINHWIDGITSVEKDILAFRSESHPLVYEIAKARVAVGGDVNDQCAIVYGEIYKKINTKAQITLKTRLELVRAYHAEVDGWSKKTVDKLQTIDVIWEDPILRRMFTDFLRIEYDKVIVAKTQSV